MHWDHSFPVFGPSLHVLGMAHQHVLNSGQLASFVHLSDEKKLAAIDNRFGHHVFEPGLFHESDDLLAFLNSCSHWSRAHHMFVCLQS